MRYDTQDGQGETRRERNKRFGSHSPTPVIPRDGGRLLAWFRDISPTRSWSNGYPALITPTEWVAWNQISCVDPNPSEWKVLREMDKAYVAALVDEIKANADRESEKGKQNT